MRIIMQCVETAYPTQYSILHTLIKSIFILLLTVYSVSIAQAESELSSINTYTVNDNQPDEGLVYVLTHSSLPYIKQVSKLYQQRGHALIWSNGHIYNNNATELVKFIKNADRFGLNPRDYDLDVVEYFIESTINDPHLIAKSDVTFSHAYIKLASHLLSGKLNSKLLQDEDIFQNTNKLMSAIENSGLTTTLENLQPSHIDYKNLLQALQKYQSIEGLDEEIKIRRKSLAIGDESDEIVKIRKILYEYGDYKGNNFESKILDEPLVLAISNFQHRHGLQADGILGRKTVRELNKPVQQRINQIILNLERARNLPELSNDRHLVINIPEYKLYVNENNQTIYQSRVVVGKKKNKTPVLSSELTELVLNPYWHVPTSIASNEIIPILQDDPDYLYKNNMKLLSKINNQTEVISPDLIDWANIDFANTSLRIRQDPGKRNSLGRVKFIFPNNHKVFLHDTPSLNLFERKQRAFSHGCIRVENPLGLAEVLLSDTGDWSKDDLNYIINRKRSKTIKFNKPIPIHIIYRTVWVDHQGIVHFRPDIYKRDSQIASALYNAAH